MSSGTLTETSSEQPTTLRLEIKPKESLINDLWVIPTFENKFAERQWAKEHMAAAFRVFAKLGYSDGAGGHISLRDPVRPDCFWISELHATEHWILLIEALTHTLCTLV